MKVLYYNTHLTEISAIGRRRFDLSTVHRYIYNECHIKVSQVILTENLRHYSAHKQFIANFRLEAFPPHFTFTTVGSFYFE
jgi:hypothetical protein